MEIKKSRRSGSNVLAKNKGFLGYSDFVIDGGEKFGATLAPQYGQKWAIAFKSSESIERKRLRHYATFAAPLSTPS